MFGLLTRQTIKNRTLRCASARISAVRHASTATEGRHVAYEEALNLIQTDKKERLEMLARVEKELARVQKTDVANKAAQLKALNALKFDLQVKSELNDPEVQRAFQQGQVDMSRPVFRYMRQKQFEKSCARLMERLTQMNVVPDLLPLNMKPLVDVQIRLGDAADAVETGIFVKPEETLQTPRLNITNFHTDTRLYTVMLVDPDSPDVANKTFQQRCHWLMTNVPLSATQDQVAGGDTVLEYIPPHPQKGTKYHRYTIMAYEQPNQGQTKVDIKVDGRDGFDAKKLAEANGLEIRGASFFRQVWDESVSKIYADILNLPEPVYGKPPKPKRYIRRAVYF